MEEEEKLICAYCEIEIEEYNEHEGDLICNGCLKSIEDYEQAIEDLKDAAIRISHLGFSPEDEFSWIIDDLKESRKI